MAAPLDLIEERLLARVGKMKRTGDKITAQCPAHQDSSPSLSVGPGTKGRDVVIKCHAGCSADAVMAALDLKWTDFGPDDWKPAKRIEIAVYTYTDATGRPLYRVHRNSDKSFWQDHLSTHGEWVRGLGDTPRVLYHLPAVLAAVADGKTVWIAEGEKDVDRLRAEGVIATCNSGGAGKFLTQHADCLTNANVVVVADRDETGWAHARLVRTLLEERGCTVRVVAAAEGKDAYDHLAAGLPIERFVTVDLEEAPDDEPEPWPDPIPLGDTDDQPEFPIHIFPAVIADHIRNTADDLQTSVDLPAMLAVGNLSTIFTGHYEVDVNGNGWTEPLNTYTATAMAPGAGKSPAVRAITKPINDHELAVGAEAEAHKEVVDQRRRMIQSRMKKAEERNEVVEAQIALDELINTPPVVIPRMIADDATPEALTNLLFEQGGRMAVISTEGGPFDMMAGRYSDKANLDVYLKAWSGDAIRVDRVGRGAQTIPTPLLTIMLTVQPSVIEALADKPEFRGRGLTTRFMYAVPVNRVGHRDMGASTRSDPAVRAAYEALMRRLLDQHRNLPAEPAIITIDRDAWSEYVGFRQGLENRRRSTGDLAQLAEWTTKLESTVARLAGILAALDDQRVIDVGIMRRAIAVGHYWLAHAKIVHDMWGTDERVGQARKIVAWVAERELREVSVRDIQGGLRRLFATAEDTKPALNLLVERGWLRPQFDGPLVTGRRGKPSPAFDTHPSLWINPAHVSHVSHVPKDVSDPLSVCLQEQENTDTRTHETHETHDEPTVTDDTQESPADPTATIDLDDCPF